MKASRITKDLNRAKHNIFLCESVLNNNILIEVAWVACIFVRKEEIGSREEIALRYGEVLKVMVKKHLCQYSK